MFRLLITGSKGQLGSELAALQDKYKANFEMMHVSHQDMDICADVAIWTRFLSDNRIDAIINTAAYTKVDKAEQEPDVAFAINCQAVENMSKACAALDCALVHYSTDFVFDGTQNTPYKEHQAVKPLGVYGSSKWQGEQAALNNNRRTIVLRTAWVYSIYGHNFVKTMRRLSAERSQINVVYDQVGSPTNAADLADATLTILISLLNDQQHKAWGELFHYSNLGLTSWFDLAYGVVQHSNNVCSVMPIETKDYPTPAKRPSYSVLASDKIRQYFGIAIPYWRDSLDKCLARLD